MATSTTQSACSQTYSIHDWEIDLRMKTMSEGPHLPRPHIHADTHCNSTPNPIQSRDNAALAR